jgi:uncharacterized protein
MAAPNQKSWNPRRLDARAFAEAGARLDGEIALCEFERLRAEWHPEATATALVHWSAQGALRPGPGGSPSVWMHLRATLDLAIACQRCLGPLVVPLAVDRWFRFVADEATAEAEDNDSDEDVLALEPRPDLLSLIEDELLMEMPLVPMHGVCPVPLSHLAADPAFLAEDPHPRPHPFAELSKLRK